MVKFTGAGAPEVLANGDISYLQKLEDKERKGPTGLQVLEMFSFTNAMHISKIQRRIYKFLFLVSVILLKGRPTKPTLDPGAYSTYIRDFEHEYLNNVLYPAKETVPPHARADRFIISGPSQDGETAPKPPLLPDLRVQDIYGPPMEPNWESLNQHLGAMREDASYHLGALRQDPNTFVDNIREEESLYLAWLDEPSVKQSITKFSRKKETICAEAMRTRIGYAIKDCQMWVVVYKASSRVRDAYDKFREALNGDRNSAGFQEAAHKVLVELWAFHFVVDRYSDSLLKELKNVIVTSPDLVDFIHQTGPNQLVLTSKLDRAEESDRKTVYKMLLRLVGPYTDRQQFGLAALLDNLEREIHNSCVGLDSVPASHQADEEDCPDLDNVEGENLTAATTQGTVSGRKKKKKKNKKKKKKNDTPSEEGTKMDFLPPNTLGLLGNLGVFAQCLHQLEMSQPMATLLLRCRRNGAELGRSTRLMLDTVRQLYHELQERGDELTSSVNPWCKMAPYGLARFDYPLDGKQTEAKHKREVRARKNLDRFWDKLLEEFKDYLFPNVIEVLGGDPAPQNQRGTHTEEEGRQEDRTPNTPRDDTVRSSHKSASEAGEEDSGLNTTTPPKRRRDQDDDEDESPGKARRIWENIDKRADEDTTMVDYDETQRHAYDMIAEIWATGVAENEGNNPYPYTNNNNDNNDNNNEADQPEKILVSPKYMDTLNFLFHNDDEQLAGRELPWKHMLDLMRHIGFAGECTGGSGWLFTPSQELLAKMPPGNRGCIRGVHAPHGKGKKAHMATMREWGKKLKERYKWTLESFAERPRT